MSAKRTSSFTRIGLSVLTVSGEIARRSNNLALSYKLGGRATKRTDLGGWRSLSLFLHSSRVTLNSDRALDAISDLQVSCRRERDKVQAMSYVIWLLVVGLAGSVSGRIVSGQGFGRVVDILLGITGACLVRFIMEQVVVPLEYVYLLLFSIWGAAAPPAMARLLLKHHNHSKSDSARTSARFIH